MHEPIPPAIAANATSTAQNFRDAVSYDRPILLRVCGTRTEPAPGLLGGILKSSFGRGSMIHCRNIVQEAVSKLGNIDILVNNAAHQATFKQIEDIDDHEWELTCQVNIHAMFYLTKTAVPHMKRGSAIINTASINSDMPNPTLLAYATTNGAIQNFTAQLLAAKGIRANAVAPEPIWTPLIPSPFAVATPP